MTPTTMSGASVPAADRPLTSGEDWIEWHGGENPVPGERVDVKYRGSEHEGHVTVDADVRDWSHDRDHPSSDIIAYRLSRPAARDEGVERALVDAQQCGVGFIVDGHRVAPERVTVCRGGIEGEDLAGKLKAIRDKFLMATPDKDHTDYAVMTRCIAALASPPVSEREREMEGALVALLDTSGARPDKGYHAIKYGDAVEKAEALLTAQSAGEGK